MSAYCEDCEEEAKKRGEKYLDNLPPNFIPIELNEDGVYSFQCTNGHVKWTFLQEQLFQILFDLGVLAISDSYTREAVSSFASSLERFYEFIIKLILLSDNVPEDKITNYWKVISKQSERQFGAYLGLFIYKFKQVPPILDNSWVKFRNDVLHNGKIPPEKITLDYGQTIADLVIDILLFLKDFFKESVSKIIHRVYKYNSNEFMMKNPQIKKPWGASYGTIIQLRMINSSSFGKIDISSEVKQYKNNPKPRRLSYIR